jgi:hypothetical protein
VAPASAGLAPGPPGAARGLLPAGGKPERLGSAVALTHANGTELAFVSATHFDDLRGIVYVYTRHGSGFRRTAAIQDPAGAQAYFGYSLAASGRTVAIAGGNGQVFVYRLVGARWRHQTTLTGVPFVFEVAMSASTLAISDVTTQDQEVAIYSRRGGGFSLQTILHGPDAFGAAVSVSGSTVAIGGDGKVWVYAKSRSGWVRQAKLTGSVNFYGETLAVSGSTLVVGAFAAHRHSGLAYIYQRSGGRWHQVARFKDPNRTPNAAFGDTTAAAGRRVLIGAPSGAPLVGERLRCGSAYEFVKSAGRWRYRARVANPGCTPGDEFSVAMAILGSTAVIGAPLKNHGHGAVYVLRVP